MPKSKSITRRQRWFPYVRQLADILHLKDWRIEVFEEQPNGQDAVASCRRSTAASMR